MIKCDGCGELVFEALGPEDAEVAIICEGPAPTKRNQQTYFEDIALPWRILKNEMRLTGLQYPGTRLTVLWHHEANDSERCWEWNVVRTIQEVRQAQFVLMCGSEVTREFLDGNAYELSGLWMESRFLTNKCCMAAPSPTSLVNGTIGEFRLALKKFSRGIQEARRA